MKNIDKQIEAAIEKTAKDVVTKQIQDGNCPELLGLIQKTEMGLNEELKNLWTDENSPPAIILEQGKNPLEVQAKIQTDDEEIFDRVMEVMGSKIQDMLNELSLTINLEL